MNLLEFRVFLTLVFIVSGILDSTRVNSRPEGCLPTHFIGMQKSDYYVTGSDLHLLCLLLTCAIEVAQWEYALGVGPLRYSLDSFAYNRVIL